MPPAPRKASGRATGIPRYRTIEAVLRDQIFTGELREGDQLPTEEALVKTYRVSRPTIRRALQVLERERLITRFAGRGTFVNRVAGDLPGRRHRITLAGLVVPPARWKIRLQRQGTLAARGEVQASLGVPYGEEISYFVRTYHQGTQTLGAAKVYLRREVAARLARSDLTAHRYLEMLATRLETTIVTTNGHIEAILADARTAGTLRARPGDPLISLRRNAHAANGTAVEHVHFLLRSSHCQIDFAQVRSGSPAAWFPRE